MLEAARLRLPAWQCLLLDSRALPCWAAGPPLAFACLLYVRPPEAACMHTYLCVSLSVSLHLPLLLAVCDDRDLTCLRVPVELNATCGPILAPPPAPAPEPPPASAATNAAPAVAASGDVTALQEATTQAAAPQPGDDSGGDGGKVGAIVGGVVGGVVAAAAAAALAVWALARRRRRRQERQRQEQLKPSVRPFIAEASGPGLATASLGSCTAARSGSCVEAAFGLRLADMPVCALSGLQEEEMERGGPGGGSGATNGAGPLPPSPFAVVAEPVRAAYRCRPGRPCCLPARLIEARL